VLVEVLQTKYLAPFGFHNYTIDRKTVIRQLRRCEIAAICIFTPIADFRTRGISINSTMLLHLLRLFLYENTVAAHFLMYL